MGLFYGLTAGASGRSGFLWPLSPTSPKFFKLPGGSGSMLRRERLPTAELDLERAPEALGAVQTE